jgi:DNA polymerase III epsilon subunit-like protein
LRKHKNLTQSQLDQIIALHLKGVSSRKICDALGLPRSKKSTVNYVIADFKKGSVVHSGEVKDVQTMLPKVLTIDIEISATSYAGWAMFNQNFSLDQIEREWFIMSFTAKWLGSDDVIYMDLRGKVDSEDDTELLEVLWKLFDSASIVVGQNHRKFDIKKINARMMMKGLTKPYSPIKTEDTLDIAKRKFGFTSNKLAWLSEHLNVKFKKLDHSGFAGYKLWKECMAENPLAWDEMEAYNIHDVLATEELWLKLRAWDDKSVNFALYLDDSRMRCSCGSTNLKKAGFSFTSLSKFQQYVCEDCGSFSRGRVNLFSKEKRASLLMNVLNK